MFHPKHVERLAGNNKILYKSVISLELFLELLYILRNSLCTYVIAHTCTYIHTSEPALSFVINSKSKIISQFVHIKVLPVALSTQLLTEMSPKGFSWGGGGVKTAGA
jgi:hypothetical protein